MPATKCKLRLRALVSETMSASCYFEPTTKNVHETLREECKNCGWFATQTVSVKSSF